MLSARGIRPLLAAASAVLLVGTATACGPAQTYILFDHEGSGNLEQSAPFTVSGPWTLRYSYDCTSKGNTSGLVIQVVNSSDDTLIAEDPDIVDAKAAPKTRITADRIVSYRNTTGTLYLQVQSGCSWRVEARETQ